MEATEQITPFPASFPLPCPLCRDAEATATDAGFSATTCDVVPCAPCAGRSGVVSLRLRKSEAYRLAVEAAAPDATTHRDGLAVIR